MIKAKSRSVDLTCIAKFIFAEDNLSVHFLILSILSPQATFVFIQPNFKNSSCTANATGHAIQPHINHHNNNGNQISDFLFGEHIQVFYGDKTFQDIVIDVDMFYKMEIE